MRIKTKRKIIIILIIVLVLFIIPISIFFGIKEYNNWLIKNAEIIVELNDNLEVEVFSEVKLSDFIKSINGTLIDDFEINTTEVGTKPINFEYINDDDIKVSYKFNIDVVDKVPPLIYSYSSLSVTKGYTGNLAKELFCGDNYDDKPKCEIIGNYDVNIPGTYPLVYQGTDSSGNISKQEFNLIVKQSSGGTSTSSPQTTQKFSELVSKYKNENTKIGLDVSRWQGDIDFEKVKNAGVEFVFIRVGSQRGIGGEYFVDPKFEQNIKGFQKVGIPVGVYFYSYANNKLAAKVEAEWVVKQLKPYKLQLPVVFDWENWSFYQEFNLSFYHLTEMANTYMGVVEKAGYKGMLYSSKNYLEKVWFKTKYPVWLAHYTEQTNYQGDYKVWQLCSNARISGISGNVDVNIMYN